MKRSLKSKVPGLSYGSKDVAAMATYSEFYNGLGYYNKKRISPYVLSGTTLYKGGMYVADGKFSATVKDGRPGTVAIIQALIKVGL
jgi:lysozyme family protein